MEGTIHKSQRDLVWRKTHPSPMPVKLWIWISLQLGTMNPSQKLETVVRLCDIEHGFKWGKILIFQHYLATMKPDQEEPTWRAHRTPLYDRPSSWTTRLSDFGIVKKKLYLYAACFAVEERRASLVTLLISLKQSTNFGGAICAGKKLSTGKPYRMSIPFGC